VALKSAQQETEKAEVIEEALDAVDKTLDRLKVLYEQYFLGIQKQPPQYIHTEVERKLRDLAQLQIRNTALRYRFLTLQQKFGSYNTYWRRTLREIDAGKYHRSLSRVTRHAAATGAEIPYEILATMPTRMREQVRRDREAALAIQRRREAAADDDELVALEETDLVPVEEIEDEGSAGFVRESTDVRREALRGHREVHALDETEPDLDLQALLRAVEAEEEARGPAAPVPVLAPPAVVSAESATDVRYPDFIALRPPRSPASGPLMPERPLSGQQPPPLPPKVPPIAPSQHARPNPIAPGSSSVRAPAAVEAMAGPFPREASGRPAPARGAPGTPAKAPPGMTEADVSALYVKYVKAKEMIGQAPGPGSFDKLMQTIHAQAPKIMEQYRANGVEFSVVIQDDQVIIRAKPKL
jgi:hypothetical protein